MASATPSLLVAILAHNEERRIGACLRSVAAERPAVPIHVIVNGSTDGTAQLARAFASGRPNVTVHTWAEGGKARSWNRFVHDELDEIPDALVFVDGDAEIAPGSLAGLAQTLAENPRANAASGLPLNGRKAAAYRRFLRLEHGIFGDLYALRGTFVRRLRSEGIRLPVDLVGEDGLVGALAKVDLGTDTHWDENRLIPCQKAGFYCEPVSLLRPPSLAMQYRRMINYSVRYFQNRIVSHIMRTEGAIGLPVRLAELYAEWLPRFQPRRNPAWWWFDRLALARMFRDSRAVSIRRSPGA